MTLVFSNPDGWLLDTAELVSRSCDGCSPQSDLEPPVCYECNQDLFAIHQPFRMDSQFAKIVQEAEVKAQSGEQDHRKKRKRKRQEGNTGEIAADVNYEQVKDFLTSTLNMLVEKGFEIGYFSEKPLVPLDNNLIARSAAKLDGHGAVLRTKCEETCDEDKVEAPVINLSLDDWKDECMFNRLVNHEEEVASLIQFLGADYLIPPKCQFLMSDITYLQPLLHNVRKFDAIVIDPPWRNKSVKRLKRYKTLDEYDFCELPVPSLAADGCLLVVWVTNKQRQREFVKNTLFSRWSAVFEAEWHWIKVTQHGETVFPLDSPHKKPYEAIILGRIRRKNNQSSFKKVSNKVLVSIPCAVHSRKPPLSEILKEFLPENARCLEMFARNLTPGWTSWGNEVLRFQHTDFFVRRELLASH